MIMEKTKKAILAVSFGTTHTETRKATIDAIEEHLAAAFPDRKLYRGWTSRFILKRLKERDGTEYDFAEQALLRMKEDGIRDVIVQPTHIIYGREYDKLTEILEKNLGSFDRAALGKPLLAEEEDISRLADIVIKDIFPSGSTDTALVLMGHGSPYKEGTKTDLILAGDPDRSLTDDPNLVYSRLEEEFRRKGRNDIFVGTVEGKPSLEDILKKLKEHGRPYENELSDGHGQPVEQELPAEYGQPSEQKPPVEQELLAEYEQHNGHDGKTGHEARSGQCGRRDHQKIKTVALSPLMIVAGDHAVNDMAGDGENSWKNRFLSEGYETEIILRGLGEYPAVREMFAEHAAKALQMEPKQDHWK